jgi:hypothetical protein
MGTKKEEVSIKMCSWGRIKPRSRFEIGPSTVIATEVTKEARFKDSFSLSQKKNVSVRLKGLQGLNNSLNRVTNHRFLVKVKFYLDPTKIEVNS